MAAVNKTQGSSRSMEAFKNQGHLTWTEINSSFCAAECPFKKGPISSLYGLLKGLLTTAQIRLGGGAVTVRCQIALGASEKSAGALSTATKPTPGSQRQYGPLLGVIDIDVDIDTDS